MSEQVSDRAPSPDEERAMEQVMRNVRDRYPAVAADVVAANMHRRGNGTRMPRSAISFRCRSSES